MIIRVKNTLNIITCRTYIVRHQGKRKITWDIIKRNPKSGLWLWLRESIVMILIKLTNVLINIMINYRPKTK